MIDEHTVRPLPAPKVYFEVKSQVSTMYIKLTHINLISSYRPFQKRNGKAQKETLNKTFSNKTPLILENLPFLLNSTTGI